MQTTQAYKILDGRPHKNRLLGDIYKMTGRLKVDKKRVNMA